MALRALTSEQITVDATSGGVSLTASNIVAAQTVRAVCTLEQAQIRYQTDIPADSTITAGGTEGSPLLEVGQTVTIYGSDDMKNVRFIRTGGTSGLLQVIYEGVGN